MKATQALPVPFFVIPNETIFQNKRFFQSWHITEAKTLPLSGSGNRQKTLTLF